MRENLKSFSDIDELRNEVRRRARLILNHRKIKEMCTNHLSDKAMRDLCRLAITDGDGNILIHDDHIAEHARQVVCDSAYYGFI